MLAVGKPIYPNPMTHTFVAEGVTGADDTSDSDFMDSTLAEALIPECGAPICRRRMGCDRFAAERIRSNRTAAATPVLQFSRTRCQPVRPPQPRPLRDARLFRA